MNPQTALATLAATTLAAAPLLAQDRPEGPVEPVADAPPAEGFDIHTVIRNLEHPWGLAFLPTDDDNNPDPTRNMLITLRKGELLLIRDGERLDTPVAGLPDIHARGQGGLMDVSLHPNFNDNRLVYLTYSIGERDANRTAMGRGRLVDNELRNFQELFRVSQTKPGGQHFGARILWLDDNSLLLSIGDGGNPPVTVDGKLARLHAQDKDSHLGKVLRLTDTGQPHPDNPFASSDDPVEQSIYTLGHRNIQGLAKDPRSGRIYASEHGARGGDELNLLEPGNNYGWPEATYSIEYWGPRISDTATIEGAVQPETVWTPCIAPCGLVFYTADKLPQWTGDLLAGGLVGEQIRVIDLDDQGNITGQTQINTDRRVRDVVQGPDGFVYTLTDHPDGELLRIVPAD
jgi:glucose/arabinose dehydrogenase